MDDFKASRAISSHSDFCKLNCLQKFIKYFVVIRLPMKRLKTSILLRLYKSLKKLTEYSVPMFLRMCLTHMNVDKLEPFTAEGTLT